MLTTAQKAILKADILARPEANAAYALGDTYALAQIYNALVVPDFIVWRTNVSADEVMRNGVQWDRVDNLSVGKARIWEWMTKLGTFNAAKVNIRAGIDATWAAPADAATKAAIYTHCKRQATVAEKLFATGTGTDAVPATMDFEGSLSQTDFYNI